MCLFSIPSLCLLFSVEESVSFDSLFPCFFCVCLNLKQHHRHCIDRFTASSRPSHILFILVLPSLVIFLSLLSFFFFFLPSPTSSRIDKPLPRQTTSPPPPPPHPTSTHKPSARLASPPAPDPKALRYLICLLNIVIMSSILNVLRSAPTPTRHFTSLQIVSSAKTQSSAFNPEHHPIVLQQLVQSLSPSAYLSSTSATSAVKDSFSGKTAAATAGNTGAATPTASQKASDKL